MLRYAVDACLPDSAKPGLVLNADDKTDDLSNLLLKLDVSSDDPSPDFTINEHDVRVQRGGSVIPQDAIIEITTRNERALYQFDWTFAFPQLFLSQTYNHHLAVHQKGTFSRIVKRTLDDPEMEKIQAGIQGSFVRLRQVMQDIQSLAKEHGQRGRLSLVYRRGVMEVYQRVKDDSCIPDDIMRRFE